MNNRAARVLLVGSGTRSGHGLHAYLQRKGCEMSVATSCREALQIINDRQFDLVLSEFMLSDGTAYQLMRSLQGTATTMFFSNAVEDGCWWMNGIFKGQDRSHLPGMRPREFRVLLDQILYDRCFHIPNSLPADKREGSAAAPARLSKVPSQHQMSRSGRSGSFGANDDAES